MMIYEAKVNTVGEKHKMVDKDIKQANTPTPTHIFNLWVSCTHTVLGRKVLAASCSPNNCSSADVAIAF